MEAWHYPSKPTSKELIYLDQLLSVLVERAGKKKVLLLIDEVQHLTTSNHFDPLAHTLRAIKRLSEANLISQTRKQGYNIEKPGLKRYLEQR